MELSTMGKKKTGQLGAFNLELLLLLSILLTIYREGFVALISISQKKLQGIQSKRIPYDGIKAWKK